MQRCLVQEPMGSITGEIEGSDSRLHSNIRFTERNGEFGISRFHYGKKGLLDICELVDAASARVDYSYNTHYKNPFHAVNGLPVVYNFSNGYFFQSRRYATTEDYYEFDENGWVVVNSYFNKTSFRSRIIRVNAHYSARSTTSPERLTAKSIRLIILSGESL